MKPEIAKLWIEDLRKNPPQARGLLFDGTGHCCLGRLCVLAKIYPWEHKSTVGRLPLDVMEWAGMKTSVGIYKGGYLITENDRGKTFAEIADIIEAHAEEL